MRPAFALLLATTLCSALAACGGAQARKNWYLATGGELMAAGSFEQARIAFRNALYIDPDNADVHVLVGEAAEKAGKLREAAQMYKGAIDRDVHQLRARARLGRLYVLAGNSDRALATIAPGIARAPADSDLLAVRGVARLRKGDDSGAYEDAAQAVEVAPANENAVALLAALHRRSAHTGKAIAVVERALVEKPQSVDLRLILAQLLLAAGRQEDAEAQLLEVVRLEPGRVAYRDRLAQLLDTYGWSMLQEGEAVAAATTLQQAVAQAPQSPTLRYHLGMAQLEAGERAAARENLRLAVESGAGFAGVQEARATLQKLNRVR